MLPTTGLLKRVCGYRKPNKVYSVVQPPEPEKVPPTEESSGFPHGQQGTLPFETTSPKNPRG